MPPIIQFRFMAPLDHYAGEVQARRSDLQLGGIAPATFWCKLLAGAALLVGYLALHPERNSKHRDDPVSLSVVIPTHNEVRRIEACVTTVAAHPAVKEILVVEGGSDDGTIRHAQNAGAKVIRHTAPPECGGGRGGQIKAGVYAARGDVVVIVHADTLLSADDLTRVLDVLQSQPMIVAGPWVVSLRPR